MTTIPEGNFSIAALIDAHHAKKTEPPRQHLGCSIIGHHCERYAWLTFRGFSAPVPGRVRRIFRRGQREEETVISDLAAIGCEFGGRIKVQFSAVPHLQGETDEVIVRGLPGALKTPHILEIKTHNHKSFAELAKNGLEKAKPQHYAQMQLYMVGAGINDGMYYSINKDNDEIYTERVKANKPMVSDLIAKAIRLVEDNRLPPPKGDITWWECKMCSLYQVCHGSKKDQAIPDIKGHCRACEYGSPISGSTEWNCRYHNGNVPAEYHADACKNFVPLSELAMLYDDIPF